MVKAGYNGRLHGQVTFPPAETEFLKNGIVPATQALKRRPRCALVSNWAARLDESHDPTLLMAA
jgi:hypothetical protein